VNGTVETIAHQWRIKSHQYHGSSIVGIAKTTCTSV
jgi:hypothetical protein